MKIPRGWERDYATKWSKHLPNRYPWVAVSVYKNAHDNKTWCAAIDFGAGVPTQFQIENGWFVRDLKTATEGFLLASKKLSEIRKKLDTLKT